VRRRPIEAAELDLIPVLSLIVHIVPMLLLNVRFIELASVDVGGPVLPTLDAPSTRVLQEQDQKVVSVRVEAEGFVLSGLDGDPRIPCMGVCTADTYDYAGLRARLTTAHAARPGEQRLVIVPGAETEMSVLIRVMDAARETGTGAPMFGEPLLAAIPQGEGQ